MEKKTRNIFVNTILLTAASLVIRGAGLVFQAYLARKIGASAIGVYSVAMSVYVMFVTLGSGGIRFAVTRLTAAAVAEGGDVRKTVGAALAYALFFGLLSAGLLYFCAEFICLRWIGETRCILALKILAASIPFAAMSAVFGGYFTGVERVMRSVSVNIGEQIGRMLLSAALLNRFGNGIRGVCASLGAATVIGESINCVALALLFAVDAGRFPKKASGGHCLRKVFSTAAPIAVSANMRTGLSSLGHILIPRGLRAYGADFERAFAAYGTIHGMAFPVLLFPSALISSMAELVIPRLTAAQSEGKAREINRTATRVIKIGLIFSVGVAGMMFFFGIELGNAIYKSASAGHYLRIFAPLVPVMYCDMITDGCLKGLGQHMKAMIINIAEATLNVILLYVLIPRYAVVGYGISIYICECFNFALSFGRLLCVADVEIGAFGVVGLLVSATAAAKLAALSPTALGITALISVYCALYVLILRTAGIVAEKFKSRSSENKINCRQRN